VRELYDDGYDKNEKAIKAHRAKRNCLFLVVDVKNDPGKVKIFDWSFSKFAKELENKLKLCETEQLGFANAEGGLVLKVLVIGDTYDGKKFFKTLEGDKDGSICPGIEFMPAKSYTDLSDDIVTQIEKIHLDEVLIVTPAAKIAELFNAGGEMRGAGQEGAEEPVQRQPRPTPTPAPARTTQATEKVGDEFGEPEPEPAAAKAWGKVEPATTEEAW
jgi:hypothetical protein